MCIIIVSKPLLISSTTKIVRAEGGGGIWLNLFTTVLCVVPSLYNVVICINIVLVCLVCLLLCKEENSSPVSL